MDSIVSFGKLVYHSSRADVEIDGFRDICLREGIDAEKISVPPTQIPENALNIFIIDESEVSSYTEFINRSGLHNGLKPAFLVVSANPPEDIFENDLVEDVLHPPLARNYLLYRIRRCFLMLQQQCEKAAILRELESKANELMELSNLSSLLMMEKDLGRLLNQILFKSREMTQSDAGSIFLAEEDEKGQRLLRFKWTQNDSINLPWSEFTFPVSSSSLAGYVALKGGKSPLFSGNFGQ